MKISRSKVYILSIIVLIIVFRLMRELWIIRKNLSSETVSILYQIAQIKDECKYSTDALIFEIPECHQMVIGETYSFTGSVDMSSDRAIFAKKRLIIKDKKLIATNNNSLFAWKRCLLQWRSQILYKLRLSLLGNLPAPHGAVLYSMLFGDQSLMSEESKELFKATGTSHLQAVSGYNFAIIATGIQNSIKRHLKRRVQALLIFGGTLIFFYLVGMQPSVIRAVASLITVLTTKFILTCQYNSKFYLALVLVLMVLWQPLWIFNISFQLTATAVAGIVYLQPLFNYSVERLLDTSSHKLKRAQKNTNLITNCVSSFTTSLAAALATAPILLFYFHELSLMGIFISTIFSLLIDFIVTVGFWTTLAAALCYSWAMQSLIAVWIKLILYLPLEVFLSSMQAVSSTSILTFQTQNFSGWCVLLWYGVLIIWWKITSPLSRNIRERVFV